MCEISRDSIEKVNAKMVKSSEVRNEIADNRISKGRISKLLQLYDGRYLIGIGITVWLRQQPLNKNVVSQIVI